MSKIPELLWSQIDATTPIEVFTSASRIAIVTFSTLAAASAVNAAPTAYEQYENSQNCHTIDISAGDTMIQTLNNFSAEHPAENTLEAFKGFSAYAGLGPNTPLAKSALLICLTPDANNISTISTIPAEQVVNNTISSS